LTAAGFIFIFSAFVVESMMFEREKLRFLR
jgi:hypothetical protein